MILVRVLYTLLVGVPLCVFCMTFGLLLCLTIIGIPVGLTMMALGVKVLG
jgi:uncharacterized membrane protein YccF (DUF307 family)